MQTYSNIEIILVDDGSTDKSGETCEKWKMRDHRIKVIHQKNQGLSAARNIGIKNSLGEFIAFVDSDDCVSKKMISRLYEAIKLYDADIAACGSLSFEKYSEIKEKSEKKKREGKIYNGDEQIKSLICEKRGITTTAWAKLYKKSLFRNIEYPTGKYYEDVFTTYKILSTAGRTCVLQDRLYYYRQSSESITHLPFDKKHMEYLYGTKERAEYVKKYYPELSRKVNAGIVYTACKLENRALRLDDREYACEKELQREIRKNILSFIFLSKSKISTKFFAILICMSNHFARWGLLFVIEVKKCCEEILYVYRTYKKNSKKDHI